VVSSDVGPSKVTAMQAALTEPDAGAVPDQEIEAVLATVTQACIITTAQCLICGAFESLGYKVANGSNGSGAVGQLFEKLTLETKTLIFFPAGCE